ncbi:hypothetical protein BD770DRAFT_410892 [Pilaira anomala]|nr:hypothetical protein BD770DRAFT_410892 [Pilaira anomala]
MISIQVPLIDSIRLSREKPKWMMNTDRHNIGNVERRNPMHVHPRTIHRTSDKGNSPPILHEETKIVITLVTSRGLSPNLHEKTRVFSSKNFSDYYSHCNFYTCAEETQCMYIQEPFIAPVTRRIRLQSYTKKPRFPLASLLWLLTTCKSTPPSR